MRCPKCGTENSDHAEFCINCHESLLSNPQPDVGTNQYISNESVIQSETKAHDSLQVGKRNPSHVSDSEKPVVSVGLNIAIIIGTIIFPIVGIAMGYTYFRKDHPDAKRAGKNWLVLGLIMFLLNIFLVSFMK
ncbi:zinc-ribbon domain-containing protein [Nitrosomonas sp. Nm166]|uniref:zinc-ribbon domain-containing protein n=1 Tax=Nitrosomonas sp. Nm166 TaxID=1881054 RepID=UPI0008EA9558|nr:zinc ribbon domain-containing protein [Nitrosomonas sp. Nm166]SFE49717.1 zinc-ribbon domain-containing protein [Nitrosomonas sp. Nm166]